MGVNQQMEDFSVCLSFFPCNSAFQIRFEEKKRVTEREREIFHLLVDCPRVCTSSAGPGWSQKLLAGLPCWWVGPRYCGTSFTAFLGVLTGLEPEQLGLQLTPVGFRCCRSWLNPLCHKCQPPSGLLPVVELATLLTVTRAEHELVPLSAIPHASIPGFCSIFGSVHHPCRFCCSLSFCLTLLICLSFSSFISSTIMQILRLWEPDVFLLSYSPGVQRGAWPVKAGGVSWFLCWLGMGAII